MIKKKKSADQLKTEIGSHIPDIWRFSLSLSGRPDIADDLTQATCLRAIERTDQLHDDKRLKGWLFTICRSIWLNELRREAVRKTGGMEAAKLEDLIDQSVSAEMNIFASQVFTKIMELPEAQRAAVELVYVEQFTYSEAAEILDVPIGTIMSRLSTARRALADLNKDMAPAEEITR